MKTLNLKLLLVAFITVLGTSLQGCGGSSNYFNSVGDTENYEIITLAGMDQNLSTFTSLAEMSGIDFRLEFGEPVTAFIPTNEAFEQMPLEQYNALIDPNNRALLRSFLQRHILPNKVYAMQFNSTQAVETAAEEEITVTTGMSGNVIYVGGAQIIKSDIEASNGIIHIVNSIVEPTRDVFAD